MSNFKIGIHGSPVSFKGIQEINVYVTREGSTSGHSFSVLDGAQFPWKDDKFKSYFSGIDPDFLRELERALSEFFKNPKHDRVQQTFESKKSETEVADMMKMMRPRTKLCFKSDIMLFGNPSTQDHIGRNQGIGDTIPHRLT